MNEQGNDLYLYSTLYLHQVTKVLYKKWNNKKKKIKKIAQLGINRKMKELLDWGGWPGENPHRISPKLYAERVQPRFKFRPSCCEQRALTITLLHSDCRFTIKICEQHMAPSAMQWFIWSLCSLYYHIQYV